MGDSNCIEQGLASSELKYRRLFETAQDGILILDADTGQITDVNPFLINMLGYSKHEFMGKRLWEIGTFVDARRSREAYNTLKTNSYIRYEDLPLQTKNSERQEVEFVSNAYTWMTRRLFNVTFEIFPYERRWNAAWNLPPITIYSRVCLTDSCS